ncbi:hypothetical protein ACIRBX_12030 [Kitasatospora sp. NPDC096147]|uniref:hypothetical protein n=1 Tax=Kitasatospora sp. NPDC096147 TaxID=3364093 RepID=UPI0038133B37
MLIAAWVADRFFEKSMPTESEHRLTWWQDRNRLKQQRREQRQLERKQRRDKKRRQKRYELRK